MAVATCTQCRHASVRPEISPHCSLGCRRIFLYIATSQSRSSDALPIIIVLL